MNRNSLKVTASKSSGLIKIIYRLKEVLQKFMKKNKIPSVKIVKPFVGKLNSLFESDDLKWDEYGNPYM